MKVKSFFAIAALSVALVSCGTKEAPVSEQLVGQWTGMDAITVTVLDSTGTPMTQTMEAPIELEYLADSTFTAVVKVNDSTNVALGAVATVLPVPVSTAPVSALITKISPLVIVSKLVPVFAPPPTLPFTKLVT